MQISFSSFRYFESLQSRYWNNTRMNDCPVLDDSDGITLNSLGGVFIATLIGLVIALITLGVEVVLQAGAGDKFHMFRIEGWGNNELSVVST